MKATERFEKIASEERFKGWPVVGELKLGAKIPYFGQILEYKLETGTGDAKKVEEYASILRHFGWVVVFGVTTDNKVITIVQWKPGVNQASWELPPGGIGRVHPDADQNEVLLKTQEFYLRETGFGGGKWEYLGNVMIESGKYRGAGPDDHGLPAHMYLATGLEQLGEARSPNSNEIMENLLVPLKEFEEEVVDSGKFHEASALPCALLALRRLSKRTNQKPRPVAFGNATLMHEDARRAIYEFNSNDGFSIQYFHVYNCLDPLGKHAHAKKSETFTIITGGGHVIICPVDAKGNQLGEVECKEVKKGSIIHIPPYIAHTFYLLPETEMHAVSSMGFDETDFIKTPWLVRS